MREGESERERAGEIDRASERASERERERERETIVRLSDIECVLTDIEYVLSDIKCVLR